ELYIQMPVMANYEFKNINFYAGPYAGLLISATRKELYSVESTAIDPSSLFGGNGGGGFGSLFSGLLSGEDTPESATINSKDGLAVFDFGATEGIGYRIDKLNFNLFYSCGFIDYRKDKGNEDTDTNQIIQFSIAYLFNIKGSKGLKDRYDLDVK